MEYMYIHSTPYNICNSDDRIHITCTSLVLAQLVTVEGSVNTKMKKKNEKKKKSDKEQKKVERKRWILARQLHY